MICQAADPGLLTSIVQYVPKLDAAIYTAYDQNGYVLAARIRLTGFGLAKAVRSWRTLVGMLVPQPAPHLP